MSKTKENKISEADAEKNKKQEVIQDIFKPEIQRPPAKNKLSLDFKIAILVIFFSILGGLLSGLIKDYWFDIYFQTPPAAISEERPSAEKILDLNFLLKAGEEDYAKVLSELRAPLVGLYRKKASEGIFESIYLEKDFLGTGVIVTSDGWLLTHRSVVGEENYVAVTNDKKILEPVQKVVDPFSQLILIKVAAENLTPARFADLGNLKPTDFLLVSRYSVQNHGSDMLKTTIQKFAYHDQAKAADFLLATEKIDHYLKVSDDLDPFYNGAILLNAENEIAGVLFNSGKNFINLAVPAYYLKSAVNNFLAKSEEILRSRLGVSYVDLSETLGLPSSVSENRTKGAVILGDAKRNILAVLANSPAAAAGLKAGDIVVKVNEEEVDEANSLTKLIQDYMPGQEITLTLIRAGQEMQVKVTLDAL